MSEWPDYEYFEGDETPLVANAEQPDDCEGLVLEMSTIDGIKEVDCTLGNNRQRVARGIRDGDIRSTYHAAYCTRGCRQLLNRPVSNSWAVNRYLSDPASTAPAVAELPADQRTRALQSKLDQNRRKPRRTYAPLVV